ncbi:MAG TPA: glycosyltransferase [Tepidisphaeraceae bacterium]|nr:glycosyltransferase [Tepidisphaeraceae bacterium]
MQALIFEPDHGGHRLHHVRLLANSLLACSVEVTVALTEKALTSPEFKLHLSEIGDKIKLYSEMPLLPQGSLKVAAMRVRQLRQAVERANAEWAYVPYADAMGQLLGVRRTLGLSHLPEGIPVEGLMFRGGFAYPQPNRWRQVAQHISWRAACAASWKVMHILDPLVYEPTVRHGGTIAKRCRLMPDPVEIHDTFDRSIARTRLGIPVDGRYAGCVGLIDRRKGVDLLIRAFAAANFPVDYRLLLAGQHEAAIREMLAGPFRSLVQSGRIVCFDKALPMHQLLDALTAMDIVCTPYPNHVGSASIVIRAAAAQRPVLGHAGGWTGAIVPRFGLGWTCNVLDLGAFVVSLQRAMDHAIEYSPPETAHNFVRFHSVKNFQACWTAEIRNYLGLPSEKEYQSWESVGEPSRARTGAL